MRILIVEDDPEIVEVVTLALQIRWPQADVVSTHLGETALQMVEEEEPMIVILDLGLPDINGYEVLKRVRKFSEVPVLILTSRDDESDIVKGLEWGADDFVSKPFRQMELISRVQAVVRRKNRVAEKQVNMAGFHFDPARLEVIRDGKVITLTRTEADIFHHLLINAGQVVPYESLAEAVWGSDYEGAVDALKVHIRRIREKIESDPSQPKLILTRPSAGYYLVLPNQDQIL